MSRARLITCVTLLTTGSLICWYFPLFHIRPLGADATDSVAQGTSGQARSVDPAAYASEVWDGPLRTGQMATEILEFWSAFDADAAKARTRYGRQPGLGGAWYFCLRGQGTIESVEPNGVVLTIVGSSRRIGLELGVVVDNRLREAIGVKASDFANSQEFNAVSSELNRRAEREVIAPNREKLKEGGVVDFVGCAKIRSKSDLDLLRLVPIQLDLRDSEHNAAGLNKAATGGAFP